MPREIAFSLALLAGGLDCVAAERAHDLGPVEQPRPLLRCCAVPDVRVVEDLVERAAALVLPDHVLRDAVLALGASEEVPEDVAKRQGSPF